METTKTNILMDRKISPFALPGIKPEINPCLNSEYTFDIFVEGQCNRLAISASIAVANDPGGTAFNPLFIYGRSGLGKTHLAQAIGNKAHKKNIVIYVTANQLQSQILKKNVINFYNPLDLLIIDDIQDLKNDFKSQVIVLQIMTHLLQNNKQIVIVSDKPPVELEGFEQRLYSRFRWGLAAEIESPDFETKLAILKRKSNYSDEILEFIAGNIKNIRDIESVLTKIKAENEFNKQIINIELTQKVINELMGRPKEITIDYIQKVVCTCFNMPIEMLQSNTRKREIAQARQIAMYFSKRLTKSSLATIGSQIGDKDHATVLYAVKRISNLYESGSYWDSKSNRVVNFRAIIDEIELKLKQ